MMGTDTLRETTKQLLSLPDKKYITFLWHGGEPLLMGVDFYKKAVEFQKEYANGKEIKNTMQSNAILINDSYLDFFEENRFSVGSSMDGPEHIHNMNRIYQDGSGSFKDVLSGLEKIWARNKKIRERTPKGERPHHLGGGVITILTKKNIERLDEIYEFFKSRKLSFKLNPLIKSGNALNNYEDFGIGPSEYGEALVKLFDKWYNEPGEGIDIDPLSQIIGDLITRKPHSCSFSKNCGESFISIGPRGDIYPCGRFDGDLKNRLGNIHTSSLEKLIQLNKTSKMELKSCKNIKSCMDCSYEDICNSGCRHNAYMVRGKLTDKDFYCASYKMLFKHIEEKIMPELETAKVKGGKK